MRELTKKVLNEYLNGSNSHFTEAAREIYEDMTGHLYQQQKL